MPYIKKEDRVVFDKIVDKLVKELVKKGASGNLNYFIYKLMIELRKKGKCKNYREMSRFLAELHESGEEIRRRILVPYEDSAIEKNGDVE